MIDNNISYGIKLSAISTIDYADLREIADAIVKLGYKITCAENGNFVCEKEVTNDN
jgi:hypothetical protein